MGIYERTNYLNRTIQYAISKDIVEYDMREAGISVIKEYGLLSPREIDELELLPKLTKNIEIGKIQRRDKEFRHKFSEAFADVRKRFIEGNSIKDDEVLSIKNDAIFVMRIVPNMEFGNILFVPTHYTSFYLFDRYEFYYNRDGITAKNIGRENLPLHEEYMLDGMSQFFRLNELSNFNQSKLFMKDFLYYYKTKQLEIGYYRELNNLSKYRTTMRIYDDAILLDDTSDISMIDIAYNFNNYILPMLQILI